MRLAQILEEQLPRGTKSLDVIMLFLTATSMAVAIAKENRIGLAILLIIQGHTQTKMACEWRKHENRSDKRARIFGLIGLTLKTSGIALGLQTALDQFQPSVEETTTTRNTQTFQRSRNSF